MRQHARNRAENLIRKFKTASPYELAENLKIPVTEADLPEVTRGFCLMLSCGTAIVINRSLTLVAKKAALAHELGHALLHPGFNYMFMTEHTNLVTARFEHEADLFAAVLLLSEEECLRELTPAELSVKYALPQQAIEEYFSCL